MTQKEKFSKEDLQKAKELVNDYAPTIENLDAEIVLYDAILEMSQWKDDQASQEKNQLIKKACEWIEYYNNNGGCLFDGWKEDFKKEMEDKL